jgi:tetratricopeptide (TPR) repeat protein
VSKREDWFRNDRWDEAERAAFFGRLDRCRGTWHRVQSLNQKSLYLRRSGDPEKLEAALDLQLQSCREADAHARELPPTEAQLFHQCALNAQAHAGDIRRQQGRTDEAIAYYRDAYRREGHPPGPYVIRWAEAVYHGRRVGEYAEMLELLHAAFERDGERTYAIYRRTMFDFAFYQAVLSFALGRVDAAKAYARAARAVMGMPDHGVGKSMSLGAAQVTAEEAREIEQILGGV